MAVTAASVHDNAIGIARQAGSPRNRNGGWWRDRPASSVAVIHWSMTRRQAPPPDPHRYPDLARCVPGERERAVRELLYKIEARQRLVSETAERLREQITEGMRAKLKRLVNRGIFTEPERGCSPCFGRRHTHVAEGSVARLANLSTKPGSLLTTGPLAKEGQEGPGRRDGRVEELRGQGGWHSRSLYPDLMAAEAECRLEQRQVEGVLVCSDAPAWREAAAVLFAAGQSLDQGQSIGGLAPGQWATASPRNGRPLTGRAEILTTSLSAVAATACTGSCCMAARPTGAYGVPREAPAARKRGMLRSSKPTPLTQSHRTSHRLQLDLASLRPKADAR